MVVLGLRESPGVSVWGKDDWLLQYRSRRRAFTSRVDSVWRDFVRGHTVERHRRIGFVGRVPFLLVLRWLALFSVALRFWPSVNQKAVWLPLAFMFLLAVWNIPATYDHQPSQRENADCSGCLSLATSRSSRISTPWHTRRTLTRSCSISCLFLPPPNTSEGGRQRVFLLWQALDLASRFWCSILSVLLFGRFMQPGRVSYSSFSSSRCSCSKSHLYRSEACSQRCAVSTMRARRRPGLTCGSRRSSRRSST